YKCDDCGKGFNFLSSFKRHTLTHGDERLYKCDDCGEEFELRCQLKKHRLTHGDNRQRFKCHECDWKFVQKFDLERHQKKHTCHNETMYSTLVNISSYNYFSSMLADARFVIKVGSREKQAKMWMVFDERHARG
uniref:C2H2-type domain-containing protein n=1 Tax=Elaeophora elaphi TaxID=1147741 RepID=A0A0R3RNS1_9BILA